MAKRPTFEEFRKQALKNREVKAAYDEAAPVYAMKRDMIAMRKSKGLTQENMAKLLGTKKSNISRLESVNNDISPRLATVAEYARALGFRMKVEFEPESSAPRNSPEPETAPPYNPGHAGLEEPGAPFIGRNPSKRKSGP